MIAQAILKLRAVRAVRAVREFELLVPPELEGCTVEQALRRGLGLSDTRIKRAKFAPEGITLDGARVFTDHPVRAGQRLPLRLPDRGTVCWIETPGGRWTSAMRTPG